MARDEFDVFAEESTETAEKRPVDASEQSGRTTTPPGARTRRRGGKAPSCGWGGMVCGRTTAVWATREDRVRMFHFENPDDFRARMPSDVADGDEIVATTGTKITGCDIVDWICGLQRVDEMVVATWRMDVESAEALRRHVAVGRIGSISFMVGDVFKSEFPGAYVKLYEMAAAGMGKLVEAPIHAKIVAGRGERFDFAVEMGLNFARQRDSDQFTVTVGGELAGKYIAWMRGDSDEA